METGRVDSVLLEFEELGPEPLPLERRRVEGGQREEGIPHVKSVMIQSTHPLIGGFVDDIVRQQLFDVQATHNCDESEDVEPVPRGGRPSQRRASLGDAQIVADDLHGG